MGGLKDASIAEEPGSVQGCTMGGLKDASIAEEPGSVQGCISSPSYGWVERLKGEFTQYRLSSPFWATAFRRAGVETSGGLKGALDS